MYLIFFLLSILSSFSLHNKINYNNFNLDIIYSPIIEQLPIIRLHHSILLYQDDEFYTLDFTPTDRASLKRTLKLLFGKNILGEIRVRKINNLDNDMLVKDKKDKKYIINEYEISDLLSPIESKELSNITLSNIKNNDIKNFIKKYMTADIKMNLYKNNCQHFSKIVYDDYYNNKFIL